MLTAIKPALEAGGRNSLTYIKNNGIEEKNLLTYSKAGESTRNVVGTY